MKIVATTSLPAVDRPNTDRWNAGRSCQKRGRTHKHTNTHTTSLLELLIAAKIILFNCSTKSTHNDINLFVLANLFFYLKGNKV